MPAPRRRAIAPSACLAALLLAVACRDERSAISGQLPAIALKDYSGKTVRIEDYTRKVTLLVFWATWCQPCLMEIPTLMQLNEKYRDKGFQVVAINVDDPEGQKVGAVAKNFGINYQVLSGDERVMKDFGGITSLPTSFLIGRDGKIKNKFVGLLPESMLEDTVLSVLNLSI